MKIAFLHYHLKTGGVATVLKGQIAALGGSCDLLVLTGDRAGAAWPCRIEEIPGVGYDRPGIRPLPPEAVAGSILDAISRRWPGGCDVLHVHNPLLAKNRQFLGIIKRLQDAGVNLFLQIHDFAEDGRPGVYYREPYPADCHYGVINARDRDLLLRAGLVPAGLHLIPNAVHPLPVQGDETAPSFVLYPVRALRRKNLGEAVLLSFFLPGAQRLAVTQPPNSPSDMVSYRDWRRFVTVHGLRVEFEAGRRFTFPALAAGAASMVTTSISEGFGLSFLEPWTAAKPLWGRRLIDVCSDFERSGVCFDTLYDRIDLPLDWIDAAAFSRRWRTAVASAAEAYGLGIEAETASRGFAALTAGGVVDFGMLDEGFQRRVLLRLMADPDAAGRLSARNPRLRPPAAGSALAGMIEANRRAVAHGYGEEAYRRRLLAIYETVVGHPVRHRIDKAILLAAFFAPERFALLKWGSYAD